MDLLSDPIVKTHVKRTANKIWFLEDDDSSKSESRLLKDGNDVEFVDVENILVADSVGHGLFILKVDDGCKDGRHLTEVNMSENRNTKEKELTLINAYDEYRGRKYVRMNTDDVWPNCVVMSRDNKIRLTDRKTKTIRTYDLRGDLITEWKPDENKVGKPHGIGVLSTGETVISDVMMHSIHVFSDTGQLLRSFGSRGDLLHHFRLPFFLTIDNNDHIIVSDNMNYCVKIFDCNGNFVNRIGSGNLFGHKQFQSPYGVTFDCNSDEILVADHESNKIFAYDKDGEFVRYYASGSGCESPCGLSVHSNSGLLALTTSNPDSSNVQLYRIVNK